MRYREIIKASVSYANDCAIHSKYRAATRSSIDLYLCFITGSR